mmetsp:Transcript_33421/g.99521  ORF Transcript_33421/g.99521 Transcript_33421/m.99521 type:complete len:228 (+) Transcript_33421:279-962(+)
MAPMHILRTKMRTAGPREATMAKATVRATPRKGWSRREWPPRCVRQPSRWLGCCRVIFPACTSQQRTPPPSSSSSERTGARTMNPHRLPIMLLALTEAIWPSPALSPRSYTGRSRHRTGRKARKPGTTKTAPAEIIRARQIIPRPLRHQIRTTHRLRRCWRPGGGGGTGARDRTTARETVGCRPPMPQTEALISSRPPLMTPRATRQHRAPLQLSLPPRRSAPWSAP